MKRLLIFPIVWACLCITSLVAQTRDSYYVYFTDGSVEAYPKEYVKELNKTGEGYRLTLINDSVCAWTTAQVDAVNENAPVYPQFTDFKFDDKLNEQLASDVDATVTADKVEATVGAIGKWLTPSYKLDSKVGEVYVDGQLQVSGVSRLRLADEVTYTLSLPGHRCFSMEKVSDEVWTDPETKTREVALTEAMLSTNAPTSRESETLGMMLDGEPATIFHSTWSADGVYEVDLSKQVYISVALTKPLTALQFFYMGRTNTSQYNVLEWVVEASNNGTAWNTVAVINEESGLPVIGNGISYQSPTIELGGSYSYVRFTASRVSYKNYLCIAEFKLYEVLPETQQPELLQPARYAYRMMPLGREVAVKVDWLTDHAPAVPRVDIDIDGGYMVSSKDYYLDALITIQGNGVWADFQDSVQIKGRGNSSWSSDPYAKNPYRLKFASSVKPFGLTKGKNWNLIAQKQHGSMMSNPMAMKAARMVGTAGANDVIPVDLYVNGDYRGSYIFTQKTGLANNSIDLDDESAAVFLELDTYYDEVYRFYSDSYRLPVNIKEPDFSEGETVLDMEQVKADFNRFETAVFDVANFERLVDLDMLARFMFVNELVLNAELNHPKSTFLYKENLNLLGSPYVFGPAWDFDWSYGYESNRQYCTSSPTDNIFDILVGGKGNKFFSHLWQASDLLKRRYYAVWKDFVENHLEEYIDYADDYLAFANSSFVNNAMMWGDGSNYDMVAENMKSWLETRAHYILSELTPYDLDAPVDYPYGDVNTDGTIDAEDRELLTHALLDVRGGQISLTQADVDATGEISVSDVAWLNDMIGDEAVARTQRYVRVDEWMPDVEEDDDADEALVVPAQQRAAATRGGEAWEQKLTKEDGLPGVYNGLFYEYSSPLIVAPSAVDKLRFTVMETNTGDMGSGYVCFALSEFYLYDGQGMPVALTADNFSTNAQEPTEGPLQDIADNNYYTYFHSTWSEEAEADHYIEITLPEPMHEFSFVYFSRNSRTVPTVIVVSEGGKVEEDDDSTPVVSSDGIGVAVEETLPGLEWKLSLSMDAPQPYIAFQMDMELPEGVNVFDDMADLVPAVRLEGTHTLVGGYLNNGNYRVVAYSEVNEAIADGAGELFTLVLSADHDLPMGSCPFTITNIRMLTPSGFEHMMADVEATMQVSEAGIELPEQGACRISYYTVEGKPLAAPRAGIVICRKVYADGRIEVVKKMYGK